MVQRRALSEQAGRENEILPGLTGLPGGMRRTVMAAALAIRVDPANPNHHLWDNNGTWFVHYTVYPTPVTAERVRCSLGTRDLVTARRKRDDLFRQLNQGVAA